MDATAAGLAPHPSAAPASPRHGNAALSATPHPAPFSPIPLFILQSKSALKGSHFIPTKAGHSSILNQRPPPSAYIKGRAPAVLQRTSPYCPSPHSVLEHHHRLFTTITRPPHRRPSPREARDRLPVLLSLRCNVTEEPPGPGAAARPSSSELFSQPWPRFTVDQHR
jgi:hypothetical protein